MVLLYMVTWIPSIYPLYVSINIPAPWILWVLHLWDVHVSISALDVDNVDKVCTELHCGVLKLLVCGDDDLRWQLALVKCQALVSTCQHNWKHQAANSKICEKNLVVFVGQILIVSWSHPYMLGSHHPSLWRAFFLSILMVVVHTNQ